MDLQYHKIVSTVDTPKCYNPTGIIAADDGTLYVTDTYHHDIRKISTDGKVSKVAGSIKGFKDGNSKDALFDCPCSITVSNDGTLYVADTYNHRIRKISTDGIVSTIAGSSKGFKDGNGNVALFSRPYGITISRDGTLYIADTDNQRIRKISTDGIVSTVAGSTEFGFRDGNANVALFNDPCSIVISHDDTLYVSDHHNYRIRKISTNGMVSTIAGPRSFGDTNGFTHFPIGIAISRYGILYVADSFVNRILKILPNGVVSVFAGSKIGSKGYKDGNLNESLFSYPFGIAISHDSTLYVTDQNSRRIRKIPVNM